MKNQHTNYKSSLAPIVLFVYNRPKHTLEVLEALSKNDLADQSSLYIFADGFSANTSEIIISNINEVRTIIRKKQWCKEVIIKEAKQNKGLANSVIDGVTEIIRKHGKVIVLEDDLLTSKYFLLYMNEALELFQNNENVKQVSGFSYPASEIVNNNSCYFLPLTSTWGWATWKRVWDTIDFECKDYKVLKTNKKTAFEFNLDGAYNYNKMFIQQMESNKISSWGIRFYWNLFKQKALVLFPDKSLVKNIGFDGSGRHGDAADLFPIKDWETFFQIESFPSIATVDERKKEIIIRYLKSQTSFKNKIIKIINTVIKSFFYKT